MTTQTIEVEGLPEGRKAVMSGWSKYPIGTKAYASTGGYWERVERGWKWCTGSTFPTPGGDVIRVEQPCEHQRKMEDLNK